MATATTSAVYITPRRSSPVVTQLVPREDGTSGNGAGPSGYQPELLFLVKDQHISAIDEYLDPEALELGDDDLNDEDFIESVHDHEWNSSVDCASKDKILNQSLVDTSNDFSSRKSDDGLDEENEQKEESGEDETANWLPPKTFSSTMYNNVGLSCMEYAACAGMINIYARINKWVVKRTFFYFIFLLFI